MKNMLFSLLAVFLISNGGVAQLMSDQDHLTMMNSYKTNLNNILAPYATQQGISIDQLKRNVVNGEFSLATETVNITNAASQLKIYGYNFANNKGLYAPDDNYAYFYAAFAPSTLVSNSKLIESTTTAGLNATEMWDCTLNAFNTSNCGSSALVSDKNDIYKLATASVNKFPSNNRTMSILLLVSGFGDCTKHYLDLENVGFAMSRDAAYADLAVKIKNFNSQGVRNQAAVDQLIAQNTLTTSDLESLAFNLGFQNKTTMDNFQCGIKSDIDLLNNNYLAPYSITSTDKLTIFKASDRYKPAQLNYVIIGQQARNLGITLASGSCSEIPGYTDLNKQAQLACVGILMNDLLNAAPGSGCIGLGVNLLATAIGKGYQMNTYSIISLIYDATGCALDIMGVSTEVRILMAVGTAVKCVADNRR